jgi:uncharacterized protein with von Willebrand factor type A (vWA) domain
LDNVTYTNLQIAQRRLRRPSKRQTVTLVVQSDGLAYSAHIDGNPADFTHAENVYAAIGDLVAHHEEEFGIRIVWPGESA